MTASTGRRTAAFTLLLLAIAVPPGESATLEINDYDLVANRPGITTLSFESGSADITTPPDISIAVDYGPPAMAEWYGDGFLELIASAGIGPDKFGYQYLGIIGRQSLIATFPGTVNFVGAWFQPMEGTQAIVFYVNDKNGNRLFTQFLQPPPDFDQRYYYGVYSDEPIGRAFWIPVSDRGPGPLRLDNLTYGTVASPAPVPAAAWLLGTGIVGLVGRRQLRARRSHG